MGKIDIVDFKRPLDLDQMIEYLRNTKRVTFIEKSEDEAKEILYEHNYINVITPFKYRFAKKGKKGIILKDEKGCHIYERDVDFSEYYQLYCNERDAYPTIFANIMSFEHLLNSIVAYEVLNYYGLQDTLKYANFINTLKANINTSTIYKDKVKEHMMNTVQHLEDDIENYGNPYIVLDNLSMNASLNVLVSIDEKLKRKCIDEIIKRQQFVKAEDEKTFYEQVSKIIKIRNCVCHNDSLEVLLRYLSRKHKTLRTTSDKHSFAILIQKFKGM